MGITKSRDEYGWSDLVTDLALSSSLTVYEANAVIWGFRNRDLHPHDLLPLLKLIFGSYADDDRVRGVTGMVDLAREQGPIVGFVWKSEDGEIHMRPDEVTIVRETRS